MSVARIALSPSSRADQGYSLNQKDFFRNFTAIVLFAVVGTVISSLVAGVALFSLAQRGWISGLNAESPKEALQFGTLLSATDTAQDLATIDKAHASCRSLSRTLKLDDYMSGILETMIVGKGPLCSLIQHSPNLREVFTANVATMKEDADALAACPSDEGIGSDEDGDEVDKAVNIGIAKPETEKALVPTSRVKKVPKSARKKKVRSASPTRNKSTKGN